MLRSAFTPSDTLRLVAGEQTDAGDGRTEGDAFAPTAAHVERATRAAERTGRAVKDVALLEFDLSSYTEEGIFGNVDTGGFNSLMRQLDWRDLGVVLPPTTVHIQASRIALLPDKYRKPLARRAAQAHAALARWSFARQVTRAVLQRSDLRWIPWRAWERFDEELQGVRAALEADKEALIEGYDAVREEMRANFRRIAQESRRRLLATDAVVPEAFVDEVVERLLAAMPSPAALRDRLFVEFRVGTLFLGSEMVAEQRKTVEARAALATEEARAFLAATEARRQAQVVQQELWENEQAARLRAKAAEEEARREREVKETLRQLRLEAERQKLAELMNPVEELAQQLHAMVFEVVSSALDSLKKNKAVLHGSTAKGLRDLIVRYRALDVTNDQALGAMIREVERELARPASKKAKRDTAEITAVLAEMKAYTYANARQLLDPASAAVVEL